MPYRSPVPEFRFILDHVTGYDRVTATDRFTDAGAETVEAILTGAARLCDDVMAPLNRAGDKVPARLENGVVRTSPGFAEGIARLPRAGGSAFRRPRARAGWGCRRLWQQRSMT